MGLDMYLEAKRHLSTDFNKKEFLKFKKSALFKPVCELRKDPFIEVSIEVAYWRKANAIHKWFIDNVQDGQDICGHHHVGIKQLKELLAICKTVKSQIKVKEGDIVEGYTFKGDKKIPILRKGKIITNPQVCEALLPSQEGFFFGNTEYNSRYLEDIDNTIVQLEKILKFVVDNKGWTIYYHSSW